MRRQNPPLEHIQKAETIEKYLRPGTLAGIYAAIALSWAAIVALVLMGLVLISIWHPSAWRFAIASIIGGIPLLAVLIAYLHRPKDPLSRYLSGLANAWRCQLDVPGDECIFKTGLRAGDEMLIVKVAFHYPLKDQFPEVRGRIYTFVHAALTSEFSMSYSLPSFSDVERALEPSMEMLATEYEIPVLYPEILDVRKMRVLYDIEELKLASQESSRPNDAYMATGTAG